MNWRLSAFADEAGNSTNQQIAALSRAGIKHIDIRGIDGFNIVALPVKNAQQIKMKLDQAGIGVHMFGSPIGKIDIQEDFQIDLDRLRHLGELRPVLDCRQVRIFSYFNKTELPTEQWQAQSLDHLRRLRDLAAELGLVLYHENERHIFGDRCPQVQLIADQLRDGEVFNLIFDFDNFNQSGDDVWDNWLKLRDRTDAMHLKDSDREHQHMPVGEGIARVREILADAVSRGWDGPVILEPHLGRSQAVMATGPTGTANRKFADLSAADGFQIAAEAATKLLADVGAPVS